MAKIRSLTDTEYNTLVEASRRAAQYKALYEREMQYVRELVNVYIDSNTKHYVNMQSHAVETVPKQQKGSAEDDLSRRRTTTGSAIGRRAGVRVGRVAPESAGSGESMAEV